MAEATAVDIGTYPLMKLAEAGIELDRLRAVLDQGRNPTLPTAGTG